MKTLMGWGIALLLVIGSVVVWGVKKDEMRFQAICSQAAIMDLRGEADTYRKAMILTGRDYWYAYKLYDFTGTNDYLRSVYSEPDEKGEEISFGVEMVKVKIGEMPEMRNESQIREAHAKNNIKIRFRPATPRPSADCGTRLRELVSVQELE